MRTREPAPFEADLLDRLTARWGGRVAVKKDELDLDGHFDPEQPDFPRHLVPVPGLEALDPAAEARILAAAWIAYNAKTAALENEIILPACRIMLSGAVPSRIDATAETALHQTIIDEHYHILMCQNAVGVTRRRRDLPSLGFDPGGWSVVRGLRECQAAVRADAERDLVAVAFALAAETTINAFLSTLSTAYDIQPMNRITVDLHRRDESGHAVVFRELIGPLYRELDQGGRELFKDALVKGLAAFRSPDHEPWVAVAAAGEVEISAERLARAARPAPPRDTGPLQILLAELGLTTELGPAVTAGGKA